MSPVQLLARVAGAEPAPRQSRREAAPRRHERLEQAAVALILVAAAAALFATAPKNGDFWWSDAPRHALNGAFVKDFIAAMPWHDARRWAIDYYLKYPALTILFYPPLFYFFLAAAYAVFGVSQWAAQAVVSLFTVLLGAATYGIVRARFPRWSALGAALLVMGGPEEAYWARQVMLDIPAYAVLVAGVFFFLRYLRLERPRDLYVCAALILAAIYIKLTAVFIVPVLAASLPAVKGLGVLRRRHVIAAAAAGVLGVIPAVLLTLKFGMINVQSVAGRPHDLPRTSLAAWLFYAEAIPLYLGYVGTALAAGGVVLALRRRTAPLETWFAGLLLAWFAFGYLFFSAIEVREPRHGMMIAFPLAIFAVFFIHRILHRILPRPAAPAVTAALGLATLVYSLFFYPAPAVEGYAAVADYVARHAPKNAVVLFSGYRDGNFIFDLRTEKRRDIAVLRADKLLLRVAVERERGVKQASLDRQQIAGMLRAYGVGLVVVQPHFWSDLREMDRLAAVLHGGDFARVAEFTITGATHRGERVIEVYKPTYPVQERRRTLRLDMPIIGETFHGTVK
ncbi:MAG TPA: glycosyltransferase family 39 protein [Stellaceae bacterium]|nr:glycosyltransferase family 39 protein [Stellaceae bacterium]